jgi:lipoate-protein ligase A
VVRRQSGGGAILHDRELTYSLTLPADHRLARNTPQLYSAVHEAVVGLLSRSLPDGDAEWKLLMHCPPAASVDSKQLGPMPEPFLCFERRSPGDVVMAPTYCAAHPAAAAQDWKIVGSAQRRHRGAILQHGSVLLARSPAAPELLGYCDLSGTTITASTLVSTFSTVIGQVLGARVEPDVLPASVSSMAQQIGRDKYASRTWTHRR